MHRLSSTLLGLAALFGAATTAFAGAGIITSTVVRLQDAVSYSTASTIPALTTFVGYTVTIANAGGNTVNDIYFEASTAVTDLAERATFHSAEGTTCAVINVANTAIRCTIGQLKAGASHPPVALFFRAPVKITNGSADGPGTDFVNLSGATYYAEGRGGPNSTPDNSIRPWGPVSVTLGTASSTLVQSGVPKAGGTFFTGAGTSTDADPFTTSANVPSAAAYTSAIIEESDFTVGCTNFVTCWQSDITIPGTFFPYLTIVLRQDALNIRQSTNIENVVIRYQYLNSNNVLKTHLITAVDCPSLTTPRGDGLPCLAKRTHYKKNTVVGWTPELDGDFEWTLISTKNGRLAID